MSRFFFLQYVHVYVNPWSCGCTLHECVCVGVGQKWNLGVILHVLSTLYLKTDLLIDLEIAHNSSLARLPGQWAPGVHPSLSPQCWDYKHASPNLFAFLWVLGVALSFTLTIKQSLYHGGHHHKPRSKPSSLVSEAISNDMQDTHHNRCLYGWYQIPGTPWWGPLTSSFRYCSHSIGQLMSLLPFYRNENQDAGRWNGFPNIPQQASKPGLEP